MSRLADSLGRGLFAAILKAFLVGGAHQVHENCEAFLGYSGLVVQEQVVEIDTVGRGEGNDYVAILSFYRDRSWGRDTPPQMTCPCTEGLRRSRQIHKET